MKDQKETVEKVEQAGTEAEALVVDVDASQAAQPEVEQEVESKEASESGDPLDALMLIKEQNIALLSQIEELKKDFEAQIEALKSEGKKSTSTMVLSKAGVTDPEDQEFMMWKWGKVEGNEWNKEVFDEWVANYLSTHPALVKHGKQGQELKTPIKPNNGARPTKTNDAISWENIAKMSRKEYEEARKVLLGSKK